MNHHNIQNIQYIVSDFDGTLTINGKLSHKVIERIEILSKKYKIIIVTGRPLSWCNMLINVFPLTAVIGENGGGYYYKNGDDIRLQMMTEIDLIDQNNLRIDILSKFPNLVMADDNIHRSCDTAVVLDSNYYDVVDDFLEYLKSKNLMFKISNIHINIWKNDYDKLSATKHLFAHVFNENIADRSIYFGDSPNDEPMFKEVKLSIGVNNIIQYLTNMISHPSHITSKSEGDGFIEFTDNFIE